MQKYRDLRDCFWIDVIIYAIDMGILAPALIAVGVMLLGFIDIPQFIGFMASFALLTLYAIWFTLTLFRNLSDGISP